MRFRCLPNAPRNGMSWYFSTTILTKKRDNNRLERASANEDGAKVGVTRGQVTTSHNVKSRRNTLRIGAASNQISF
jgi:hypothetical protein